MNEERDYISYYVLSIENKPNCFLSKRYLKYFFCSKLIIRSFDLLIKFSRKFDYPTTQNMNNKLGLSWAKLSPSWGLKLELEVEV